MDGRHPLARAVLVFAAFALLAVILALPHLYRPVYDWDESTFIVLGDDLLKGHLPYSEIWDVKPPLLNLLFAGLVYGGKTIAGIRLLAWMYVALAALVLYLGTRAFHPRAAFWAGLLLVVYALTLSYGVLSEHMLLLPLALLVSLCGKPSLARGDFLLAGFLAALLALIRTNMLLLFPGICLIALLERRDKRQALECCGFALAGLLVPVLPLLAVYHDKLPLLAASLVLAPLHYSDFYVHYTGHGAAANFLKLVRTHILSSDFSLYFVLGLLGMGYCLRRRTILPSFYARRLAVLCACTVCSIAVTGLGAAHYLLQLVPFLSVSLAFALYGAARTGIAGVVMLALCLLPLRPFLADYAHLPEVVASQKGDDIYKVADYLNNAGVSGRYVYFCDLQILYFLTGAKVPYYLIHPLNYTAAFFSKGLRPYAPNAVNDERHVLDKKPDYIVYNSLYTRYCPNIDGGVSEEALRAQYEPPVSIGILRVHKRRELAP